MLSHCPRRSDPSGAFRAHLIAATAAGEEAVAEFLVHLEKVLHRVIYTALDETEIETLIALLAKVSKPARLKPV